MSLQTVDFDRLRLNDSERILDLGCGEGRHAISAYMVNHLDAVGVDLSADDLKTTRERFGEFVEPENENKSLVISVANAEKLPFSDESFDKVICSEVMEHIPEYRTVIGEINRVLKTGGIAAISVPRYFPEWVCWQLSDGYHEVEGGHIRIFKANELREDVESAGFICYDRHHAHSLHVPYWWLKCLFWRPEGEPNVAIVDWYHRFLTWDLMKQPVITRLLDWLLNPIMGKSVVMYFVKLSKRAEL
ncbi:MAG: class I SAM-dependent methyltransferase [Gammaproteobacteria bacterium]|jgi:SAM-dependent methyltransferase|nr:class I SAM-dependent methyltransferase [Gammaproteobacteria bacterium]MBT4494706.1 class I SAM-dependent methyltransferase [Gammaproteobacteria bacterium]MBT7370622.1 class I SAM-dependent methyltransferase [Gammaproteobacteria bacterium]